MAFTQSANDGMDSPHSRDTARLGNLACHKLVLISRLVSTDPSE